MPSAAWDSPARVIEAAASRPDESLHTESEPRGCEEAFFPAESLDGGHAVSPPVPQAAVVQRHGRLVDHPFMAWLLENSSIVALAKVIQRIPEVPAVSSQKTSTVQVVSRSVATGVLMIEGMILMQKVLTDYVYGHIPYFTAAGKRTSSPPLREVLGDWLRCNLPTHVASSTILAMSVAASAPHGSAVSRRRERPFSPGRFLLKLAAVRLVADVAYYAIHRVLHLRWLYRHIHKRHHEHKATALVTNFHFTPLDLLLEGFVPLFAGMTVLGVAQVPVSRLEALLITGYIQWYEIGSHSGKPMPTVTYFPPLAPFYKNIAGDVDARNVEFHDIHHESSACNYGITQWLDHVLGTAKLSRSRRTKELAQEAA